MPDSCRPGGTWGWRGRLVNQRAEAIVRGWRYVEPARLEHHRHHRQPRQHVVRRLARGIPQAVMRGQRAVLTAERPQSPVEQREMHRLVGAHPDPVRSEEHTSELQSLMRISYAVFCLKKKKIKT